MSASNKAVSVLLIVLLCVLVVVARVLVREDRHGALRVSFMDVGQGDAIFIDTPSGAQVLIDGGPGSRILRPLAREMPWYDRSIDIVVSTHPDADHTDGLIDVFDRYDVATIVRSSVRGGTALAATLEDRVMREGAQDVDAQRGEFFDLGAGARLEILFPDREVPDIETNVGCVVTRLVYGDTAFLFPCDAPSEVEEYLVRLDSPGLLSDVLKAGHHGSKTSSSPVFVAAVSPEYAVFSRGCDNRYGHPHAQTIETFSRFSIPTSDTCGEGTVTFVSDGRSVVKK